MLHDVFDFSNAESDFVANIEECASMEADVQEDSTVLTQGEHVVSPSDTLPPVEKERGDENRCGENVQRGEHDLQVVGEATVRIQIIQRVCMAEDVGYHVNDSADSEDVEEDDVHLDVLSLSDDRKSRQEYELHETDDKVEVATELVKPDTFVVDVSHSFVAGESGDKFDDSNGHMEEEEQLPEGSFDWKVDDPGEGWETGTTTLPIVVADLVVMENQCDCDSRYGPKHGWDETGKKHFHGVQSHNLSNLLPILDVRLEQSHSVERRW